MHREPISLYEYNLPRELIAQTPLPDRAASRMLVLNRNSGEIRHLAFRDILEFVDPGGLWVFNDTRVFPARVFLKKDTGADIEVLFLEPEPGAPGLWRTLARPGKRLRPGTLLWRENDPAPVCRVAEKRDGGVAIFDWLRTEPVFDFLDRCGVTPLPPYIKERLDDRDRYQTVYAQRTGSAAAPTAGLHFTPEILSALEESAHTERVTLHIGMDTFQPVAVDDLADHRMHTEHIEISESAAAAVCNARDQNRRVTAVGTTAVRALEAWAAHCVKSHGELRPIPLSARTDLFIHQGHTFRAVDALLTNFHLPRSTLLVMICAFAGRENVLRAYAEAVERRYRFFSFGDAMLIL